MSRESAPRAGLDGNRLSTTDVSGRWRDCGAALRHYETTGLHKDLPDLDRIIPGVHNPHIGPAIRFEPGADPFFVPAAPG
jgi:hypothetical protein